MDLEQARDAIVAKVYHIVADRKVARAGIMHARRTEGDLSVASVMVPFSTEG
jgi:hypothetical protein